MFVSFESSDSLSNAKRKKRKQNKQAKQRKAMLHSVLQNEARVRGEHQAQIAVELGLNEAQHRLLVFGEGSVGVAQLRWRGQKQTSQKLLGPTQRQNLHKPFGFRAHVFFFGAWKDRRHLQKRSQIQSPNATSSHAIGTQTNLRRARSWPKELVQCFRSSLP